MWLLTSEPQSAWLVLSHEPGAPPVIRFHQPFDSWARSSQHPPLLPPTFIQSTAVHFTLSTNQRLNSFNSPNIYGINGNSPWLTSVPIPQPPPPKKGRKNLQLPHPTSHQASPTFASCGIPLCNSTPLTISLPSLRHFYHAKIPQNSKLLLSCSL